VKYIESMEFNEKLIYLRKEKGLTQEHLAEKLYVSRTAVSKWESGKGYPNIDSLKAISEFFSVTVDELLSCDEIIIIAENDSKDIKSHYRDAFFGLLDVCTFLLLFLPLFAERTDSSVFAVSLLSLCSVSLWIKGLYLSLTVCTTLFGLVILVFQSFHSPFLGKSKYIVSFVLNLILLILFILSSHVYAAVFVLVLIGIKAFMLINKR